MLYKEEDFSVTFLMFGLFIMVFKPSTLLQIQFVFRTRCMLLRGAPPPDAQGDKRSLSCKLRAKRVGRALVLNDVFVSAALPSAYGQRKNPWT